MVVFISKRNNRTKQMRIKLLVIIGTMLLIATPKMATAQQVISTSATYDIDYLTPKKYEIAGITIEGAEHLENRMIQLVSGLKVGDQILVPGDKISSAIDKLWQQGVFDDVQITAPRIQDNLIFLNIKLSQRPRLSKFQFKGVKKNDVEKIREEIKLVVGDVVTENLMTTSANLIKAHYIQKGYHNVEVNTIVIPDTTKKERREVILVFDVDKGEKVKIKTLTFEGNNALTSNQLQREMKNTHDVNYWKKLYFWTSGFWKKSKYIDANYRSDLNDIIEKYNELGYRDAKIETDSVYTNEDGSLGIKIKIYEGNRYYFRNVTFTGNTVYPSSQLARLMKIEKGDPYNKKMLEQNVSVEPTGTDNINSLYMDNGYLAFRAMPTEIAVENDSIDIEVRMHEGNQYRVNKVSVEGNTITNDKIIMRELYTRPGDLYSKDLVMRSLRELATMQFFKQESLVPDIKPNDNGTVDITYQVEEQSTSQISLSGGWGGDMVIGTVGLSFNNFSVRNLFNRKAWNPLPSGDGQQLTLSAQTNGDQYYSVNLAFTEPWLGGKKPQALSVNIYRTLISNGYYYDKNSEMYYSLRMTGGGVSLAKRLTWPDNYFILSQGLVFRQYDVHNYTAFVFSDGTSNDLSYNGTLSRNSLDSPIYPLSGSEISMNLQITPPYSLFNSKDYAGLSDQDRYKWLEYYKINLRGSWMFNLVGDLVLNTRFRFGLMGYYNEDIGLTPFGRYYLGGDGLSNWSYDARDVIAMRGYSTYALTPKIGSDYAGAAVFDKFTLELRQPLTNTSAATIYLLGFLEAGNAWLSLRDFQPFRMYTSAGLGVRLYMQMFGLIGVDWGYGFDDKESGGSHFHFSINQSID